MQCIILGDLNVAIGKSHTEVFSNNLNFKSLIAEPTFYENPNYSFLYGLIFDEYIPWFSEFFCV